MRLIDIDKVIERERYYAEKYKGDFGEIIAVHMIKVLDSAPTVDAIPIEWIENYLRNYQYMAPIEKNFVRELIKAWEERKE